MLGGKNHFLTPTHNWIHDCIWDLRPGLDPEVGSSLEYEYSVTHGDAKAAWYSPWVGRSLGGVSARILGGKVIWVVGWVCGRILYWYEKAKLCIWGLVIEFCSGHECV